MVDRVVLLSGAALAIAILTGLFVRGHWRAAFAFDLFIASVAALNTLLAAWPERFFTPDMWLVGESLQSLLTLGVAFELVARVFGRLPHARQVVSLALLAVLLALAASLLWLPRLDSLTTIVVIVPRLQYVTSSSLAVVLAAALWYHVPLHQLHKAILMGWVPYLAVFAMGLQVLRDFGWHQTQAVSRFNMACFVVLHAYWTSAAWRRQLAPSAAVLWLQPWRSR